LFQAGAIGRLIQMRARYGHGGRPGVEKEWRANAEIAGGGELLDQGVHIIDLFQWFGGPAVRAQAEVQQAVWQIGRLEDNAFGLLRFAGGAVGQFHVSMTQWKNLFSFEIHGDTGALLIDGLGGSYGVETLTIVRRNMAGGVPVIEQERFEGSDVSWAAEWSDFVGALHGERLRHGGSQDGLRVMATVDALYAAARSGGSVDILAPAGSRLRQVPE
jgi:predicted dehydrogenase